MIALLAPILVFLLFLGLVSTLARGQSGWILWAKATALLAAFRLGVLWFLLLVHWRGALGLWAIPLILVPCLKGCCCLGVRSERRAACSSRTRW